jgi:hypothetical protein
VRLEGLGQLKNPKGTDSMSRKIPENRISKLFERKKVPGPLNKKY